MHIHPPDQFPKRQLDALYAGDKPLLKSGSRAHQEGKLARVCFVKSAGEGDEKTASVRYLGAHEEGSEAKIQN